MSIDISSLECIGCGACEMACNFMRDETCGFLSSSIMLYHSEEKKHYFGLILKTQEKLVMARPEGTEERILGESAGGSSQASAKPVLLREGCIECADPLCVKFCPTEAITRAEED